MTPLRVMTFNIRGGLGMDGKRRTSRIADVVRAQNVDIVCFQEVHQHLPWSRWIDQPGQIKRALGMEFVFEKAFGYFAGGYGLGMATRLPVKQIVRRLLPGHGEPRIALQVILEWDDKPLSVFCTHWGLNREDRLEQARCLAPWVDLARWEHHKSHPVIVCGDFNDTVDSDSLRLLLTQCYLSDAGAVSHLPTYPSDAPRARIDGVFYSPDLTAQNVSVIETQVSDHLPLVVEFGEVPPPVA